MAFAHMLAHVTIQVVSTARVEIIVFAIALATHMILFGRRSPSRSLRSKPKQAPIPPSSPTPRVSKGEVATANAHQIGQMTGDTPETCLRNALTIFEGCSEKTIVNYMALMDMCLTCGDLLAAERVVAAAAADKCVDISSYNKLVKAHLQAGNMEKARRTIADMRAVGIMPNVVTFNELIDSTVKQDAEAAWSIVDEMVAAGVKPTPITCSILLKSAQPSLCPSNLERALALVQGEEVVDEVLLSSQVEACIRTGRTDLLKPILERHRSSPRVHMHTSHALGSIIRGYGIVQDLPNVWATWRELRTRQVAPTSITIGCMTEALATNADPEGGLALIHELMADPATKMLVNAVTYCSVVKGFSHQKRFARAWEVYLEMKRVGVKLTIVTYNTLADACARNDEMARIPELLEEMIAVGIRPNVITYSVIVKGYCKIGRIARALEVMDEMRENATLSPDEHTYNTVINGCARQGHYDQGVSIFEEMCKAGVKPSNFTLTVIVKLAGRCRRVDSAFELCDQIAKTYNIKPNVHVYNGLVQACVIDGQLRKAVQVLATMVKQRVRPDVRSYTLLLQAYTHAGKAQETIGLVHAGCGLPKVHPDFEGLLPEILKPPGGLPKELLVEVLQGLARNKTDKVRAEQLLQDLGMSLPECKRPDSTVSRREKH
mmetsp:Transcript_120170/g.340158  ORF Transcript_120170/g.340158 Transcript_120170/m.340158 type:complete len:662 (+) Transcript_120170:88-2073(+)